MCQSWQPLLKHLASRTDTNILHLSWQMERKSWKNLCPWITHCQQQKLNATANSLKNKSCYCFLAFYPSRHLPFLAIADIISFRTCCSFCRMICNLFYSLLFPISKYLLQIQWLDLFWPCSCDPHSLKPSQFWGNIQIGLYKSSQSWLSLWCLSQLWQ